MAHFLIADDEPNVRAALRSLLKSQDHTCEEAGDLLTIVKTVVQSEANQGDLFDLILMDYDLRGPTGLEAIEKINLAMKNRYTYDYYCDHRVVVVTGSCQRGLSSEFAQKGAIGHLHKPIQEVQFWSTIDAALTRRELYIDKKNDWESAVELLENLGILQEIDSLRKVATQYEALNAIYQNLLRDLDAAGQREQQIAQAYSKASASLNAAPGSFKSIYTFLEGFGYTRRFLEDAEEIFACDRLHFFSLQLYLQRIRSKPDAYMVKHLAPKATGHYEYRVGRNFRLYFRKAEAGRIVLERFGHKTVQPKLIEYLNYSQETDVSLQAVT